MAKSSKKSKKKHRTKAEKETRRAGRRDLTKWILGRYIQTEQFKNFIYFIGFCTLCYQVLVMAEIQKEFGQLIFLITGYYYGSQSANAKSNPCADC